MFGKFKQLGLTDKEARVYIFLLMLGKKVDVRKIQSSTLIPRTSIYSVVKGLIKKGMVAKPKYEDGDRLVEHYVANDPAMLLESLARQRDVIKVKEVLAKELISEVSEHFCAKQLPSREQVGADLATFFSSFTPAYEKRSLMVYQSNAFNQKYAALFNQHIASLSSTVQMLIGENFDMSQLGQFRHVTARQVESKFAPAATLFCHDKAVLWVVSCADETQMDRTFLIHDINMVQDCMKLLLGLWSSAQTVQLTVQKQSFGEMEFDTETE